MGDPGQDGTGGKHPPAVRNASGRRGELPIWSRLGSGVRMRQAVWGSEVDCGVCMALVLVGMEGWYAKRPRRVPSVVKYSRDMVLVWV